MTDVLANRVKSIKPSPTFAINTRAKELRAEGHNVISMGVGEPDFNTPDFIKQAAIEAINSDFTRYTAADGTPELKAAIIDKFKQDNQVDYQANQIIVGTGAKQVIYNTCQVLLNPGDEAIIPAPYWVSYPAMVELAEGVCRFIEADITTDFKITAEQLENAITDKTKLFFLNQPSNPTGMRYTAEELTAIGEVLKRHPHVYVMCDDMYEHILWPGNKFVTLLNVAPELYDRTILSNGVSKAYCMTGWRIGYAGGPLKVIGAMKKLQSHSTSNPSSISQRAATAALTGDQAFIGDMVNAFKERHDYMIEAMNKIDGIKCIETNGTFYLFPNIEGAMKKIGVATDAEFAQRLLEEKYVGVVPGSGFGGPNCMRLSIALSLDTLKDAAERIADFLS